MTFVVEVIPHGDGCDADAADRWLDGEVMKTNVIRSLSKGNVIRSKRTGLVLLITSPTPGPSRPGTPR